MENWVSLGVIPEGAVNYFQVFVSKSGRSCFLGSPSKERRDHIRLDT